MSRKKDYYATLGVTKDAKDEDIKKAFRRLAKDLHPDVGGDAEKFKEVNEAYETLSDGNKRRIYDSGGTPNGNFPGNGFQHATNMRMEDFFNIGGMRFGFGFDAGGQRMNQQFRVPPHVTIGISVNLGQAYVGGKLTVNYEKTVYCKKCSGLGRTGSDKSSPPCHECGGAGKKSERASSPVEIPPRTMNFSQVVVPGAGNILKDGQKGDLMVQVTYHPQYEDVSMLHDGTLVKDLHVPWESSLLGEKYRFSVTSESKDSIDLVLNSSTPNGGAYRLRGLGMGNGADLIVKVWHMLPTNIREEDRKAIARAIQDAKPDTVR